MNYSPTLPTTPSYVVDIDKLEANLQVLSLVKEQAECNIVLALKAFSLWHTFPLIANHLDGCCASGLHEALLSNKHMGKDTLIYSPAYTQGDLLEVSEFSKHLTFNSASQWSQFQQTCLAHPRYKSGKLRYGLRVNPEHSTGRNPQYDPCSPNSRLGATKKSIRDLDLTGITGLHFHTLCEQFTDDLESTLEALDHRFGDILMRPEITWLNMGGGHWITKPDYDRDKLAFLIQQTRERYNLKGIWLEPGEAVAIHTGELHATVLDIVRNGESSIVITNVSATAHMPDTLEMPYKPEIQLSDNTLLEENSTGEQEYHFGGPIMNTLKLGNFPTKTSNLSWDKLKTPI